MRDEPQPEVALLQVASRMHGIDDPQLVSCPACRYVVDPAPFVGASHHQRLTLAGGVDEGKENDISLVALELGGATAENPAALVFSSAQTPPQDRVDLDRLLRAHHADRTD